MSKVENKYFGFDSGYCRICGEHRKLTEDHIPPKKCGNNKKVFIMAGDEKRLSQNGLKLKTLCLECNGNRLGGKFDPELVRLHKEVKKILPTYQRSKFPVTSFICKINPNLLLRSVLGHLLSSTFGDVTNQNPAITLEYPTFYTSIQEYVLEKTQELKDISIYYWFYPYEEIRILHYFGHQPKIGKSNQIFGILFKFFPLAIWIVDKKASTVYPNQLEIPTNSDSYDLILNIENVIGMQQPEFPVHDGFTVMSSAGLINTQSPNKHKSS